MGGSHSAGERRHGVVSNARCSIGLVVSGCVVLLATNSASATSLEVHQHRPTSAAGGWQVGHALTIPHSTYTATVGCATPANCVGSAEAQFPFRTRLFSVMRGKVVHQRTVSLTHTFPGAACPDRRHCLLVGDNNGHRAAVVPWSHGRIGRIMTTAQFSQFDGIACPTRSRCLAVGNDAGLGGVATLRRSGHLLTAAYTHHASELDAVACWSAQRCIAVGDKFHGVTISTPITRGRPGRLRLVRRHSQLAKVACTPRGLCVASGSMYSGKGLLAVFRGGRLVKTIVTPQYLYGAACPTASVCLVTGATSAGRGATGIVRIVRDGRPRHVLTLSGSNGAGDTTCPTADTCIVSSGTGTRGQLITVHRPA